MIRIITCHCVKNLLQQMRLEYLIPLTIVKLCHSMHKARRNVTVLGLSLDAEHAYAFTHQDVLLTGSLMMGYYLIATVHMQSDASKHSFLSCTSHGFMLHFILAILTMHAANVILLENAQPSSSIICAREVCRRIS